MPPRGKYWEHHFNTTTEAPGDGHPCARGQWCADATRTRGDDGKTHREPVLCYQTFCQRDEKLVERSLLEFPATYERLTATLGTHVTRDTTVREPFGPSVPIRLDVDEIMRIIVDAVVTWHERVATVAPTLTELDTATWRARALGPHAARLLTDSSRILTAHLSVLLALPPAVMVRPSSSPTAHRIWGGEIHSTVGDTTLVTASGAEAGNELLRLDYLARAAMLETMPAPEQYIGVPCQECERRALRAARPPLHDGDPEYRSECVVCGDLMTTTEYTEWVNRCAAFYRTRVTPAQSATRL